jgi:hypothetical protein
MRLSPFLIIAISAWTLLHGSSSAQTIPVPDSNGTSGVLIICGEGLIPSYANPKTSAFAHSTSETFAEALRNRLEKNGIPAELYVHRDKFLNIREQISSLLLETKRDSLIQVVFGNQKSTSQKNTSRTIPYLEVSYMKLIYSSDQGKRNIKINNGPKKRYLLGGRGKSAISRYADEFAKTLEEGDYFPHSTLTRSDPKITNYKTEGNLESTLNVDCVDIMTLNNKYTPSDLFKGVAKCVNAQNYRTGGDLFSLAGVYGRFDALRVVDKTAHQAVQVLILENVFPLEEKKRMAFYDAYKNDMQKGSASLNATCIKIKKIGPPGYYPKYMIQHGMGAFRGKDSNNGIKADFDAEKAWNSVLGDYLHCPDM